MEIITFASTSNVLRVKLLDSTSTTGAGKTGLTSASSGLIISTIADNEATATSYTVAGSTIETITTLGTYAAPTATKCRFKEVDSTNHPGVYELQIADARFAVTSAKRLLVSLSGATGMVQVDKVIELKRLDLQSSGVALTTAERQKDLRRIYGVYGTVWCVSPNGNDTTGDGLTWDTAYLTPTKALTVAATGDLILLSAGTFDLGSGGLAFNGTTGISMIGAGIDRTIITSTGVINSGNLGCIISLGSGALYADFTVQGSTTAEVYAGPLGVDSAAAFPFAVTNTTVRRVKTVAWSDGLYLRGTGTNSLRFEQCQFVSNYDCLNIFGGGDYTIDLIDCHLFMQQSVGATQGGNNDSRGVFFNRPGTLRMVGGSIYLQSDEASAVLNGLKLGSTAGSVNAELAGVRIATRSSGSGGTAYDLYVRNTGVTTVAGCAMDRGAVSLNDTHTVTYRETTSQLVAASTAGKQDIANAGLLVPSGTAASGSAIDYAAKGLKVSQANSRQ